MMVSSQSFGLAGGGLYILQKILFDLQLLIRRIVPRCNLAFIHAPLQTYSFLVNLDTLGQQSDIAVKRLGDLMDAPTEPYSLIPARANSIKRQLDFESISFRYSENHPWLYQQLNINIKPQKCTVIMGPSCCGKSTLAKLMLGFLQPQEGGIKLDGKDIRYMSANELRNVFGVVPQETTLFSGTLYENLTLANPHASFEQIIMACQLAGIHETIEQLPQGYQTPLGEHEWWAEATDCDCESTTQAT